MLQSTLFELLAHLTNAVVGRFGSGPAATSGPSATASIWSTPRSVTVIAVLSGAACHGSTVAQRPAAPAVAAPQVANLHAFARLYGVVRWFHPSDAGAVIDWDRLAMEGARRIATPSVSMSSRGSTRASATALSRRAAT
jgi:hypothetical protein